jgi:hypothetical protein
MNDKSLRCNTTASIYQYDNNIDKIRCLVPCVYEGKCLINATVILCYKDESCNGGFIELKVSDDSYNNDYHQFINKINSKITQHVGKITVWLKINNIDEDYSFETDEGSFIILPRKETPKNTQSQQLSYFDQWLIKITQTYNSTLKVQKDVINQSNVFRMEIDKLRQEIATLKGGDNIVN